MKIFLCLDTKDQMFRGLKANMKGIRFEKTEPNGSKWLVYASHFI